ncbi:hypothetical protein SLEP1_g40221 [Rubroshorea leprosula]|uniref:Uncharacterized protein n=1 Tax=Rubroshorea leprosula TaxID=152421 RepID=A0AAV5L439_9ROSI|nr:hypothetical protein SLEP1_g40221 [Rubroshorea leprosula]
MTKLDKCGVINSGVRTLHKSKKSLLLRLDPFHANIKFPFQC